MPALCERWPAEPNAARPHDPFPRPPALLGPPTRGNLWGSAGEAGNHPNPPTTSKARR